MAFLSGDPAEAIQRVRSRFDPAKAAQIGPHITLLYETDIEETTVDSTLVAIADALPLVVRLGVVSCWGHDPAAGTYLPVDDVNGAITAIRPRGAADGLHEYRPHVTLTHPRTAAADDAASLWLRPAGQEIWSDAITIDAVAAIRQDGETWKVIATVGRSGGSGQPDLDW